MAATPEADFTLSAIAASPRNALMFVAMEQEAAPMAEALRLERSGAVRVGSVAGAAVTLVTPGIDPMTRADFIGPVHASAALASALARGSAPFDLVVNIGTAGGFDARGQRIADLVVARDTMFHDARVAIDGFDRVARAHTRLSADDTARRSSRSRASPISSTTTSRRKRRFSAISRAPQRVSRARRVRS